MTSRCRTSANACFLDSATLTPLLARLESGLINRHRSRKDERQVAVTLSEAGRELQQQALGIPHAVGCAAQCDTDTLLALKQQLELCDNSYTAREAILYA